jgi:hypothetical protein
MRKFFAAAALLILAPSVSVDAWGPTAHRVISRVAVATLPDSVPPFLQRQIDWIGVRTVVPDSWRAASEPFVKMEEDPNHEWYIEQFSFLKTIPRSRTEFILAIYDEHLRLTRTEPAAAARMNIGWTGTLPYQTVEIYERLKVAFREWRALRAKNQDTQYVELDAAFFVGWLGHYVGDGGMPLHTSIHHDGWQGDNPKNFTRSGAIHWGFENDFVERIDLADRDIASRVPAARRIDDPFSAMLTYLAHSHTRVEQVYTLDQQHAFDGRGTNAARDLVYACTTDAAAMLRNLIFTAWVASAGPGAPIPPPPGTIPPNDPAHPRYNPATGSAPADHP